MTCDSGKELFMRQGTGAAASLVVGAAMLLTAACSPSGGAVAALPEGETDLSCAALAYAANDLVGEGRIKDSDGFIAGNYLGAVTRYGTAHATAEKLDQNEVLGVIKVKAFRMTGAISGGDLISDSTIAERAKKCMGG
jgi:hypothetical protein